MIRIITLGLALGALSACDDELFPAVEGGAAVTSAGCDGVAEVIAANCLSCHSAAGAAGGLDLETDWYSALVNGGLVTLGDPAGSVLYQRLTSSTSPMPPTGALGDDTVAIVGDWIASGETCDGSGGSDVSGGGDTAASDGAALFAAKCAACHGADGNSGYSPRLSDEVPGKTMGDLVDIIQNGTGSMPAQYPDIADAETVAAYVLDTFGG